MASRTMQVIRLITFLLSSLLSFAITPYGASLSLLKPTHFAAKRPIKAGYWPSWRSSVFPASSIETSYFTHILYAFLVPSGTTYELIVDPSDSKLLTEFSAALQAKKPPVKALISIGGGGGNPTVFADMAASAATRAAFINSAISVARKYNLDGLDLDWEFPKNRQEMVTLGVLFTEWRRAIDREAAATGRRRLLLTAAVYYASEFILADHRPYPEAAIRRSLDFVNVMSYDYHGSWDTSQTGAHAALFDPKTNISTSFGLGSWVRSGVPRSKIVMGLPLYGRTWRLKDPLVNGLGAPAVAVGPGDGTLFFYQVMEFNKKNNATVVFDRSTVSTYSYAGTDWIGYDDATSVTKKITYARGLGLGGYFFWAVGYDEDWIISKHASKAWSC